MPCTYFSSHCSIWPYTLTVRNGTRFFILYHAQIQSLRQVLPGSSRCLLQHIFFDFARGNKVLISCLFSVANFLAWILFLHNFPGLPVSLQYLVARVHDGLDLHQDFLPSCSESSKNLSGQSPVFHWELSNRHIEGCVITHIRSHSYWDSRTAILSGL